MASVVKTGIKYLLIGDLDSSQILTEFTTAASTKQNQTEGKQIFEKSAKLKSGFNERNKITAKNNSNYFFIKLQPNLFFLILVESDYPERLVFQMVDQIIQDHIPLMINSDKNELNPQGRQALKAIVDKYQDAKGLSKIAAMNEDVEAIKVDMQKNIKNMVSNMDDIQVLEEKSEDLKESAEEYKNDAKELERLTWWQNAKLKIILASIIAAIIIGIIIWLCCTFC